MPGTLQIGVLAFQGGVTEHIEATTQAALVLGMPVEVKSVRTKDDLPGLNGLVIPGGESTTLYKLCVEGQMIDGLKRIKNIFGTCAGAIMLAKTIHHIAPGQKTLDLMNIEADRNAYGRQSESFETRMNSTLGAFDAVFIRAPKITAAGPGVRVLADLRTADGVNAALGTHAYPASVLYAKGDWIRANRDTAERLARAITRTLAWMQTHTPQDIADKTPKTFRGEDDALYVEALKASMPMFSPDGLMAAEGAEAVRTLLASSMEKVRTATIDVAKTYTNEFIRGR